MELWRMSNNLKENPIQQLLMFQTHSQSTLEIQKGGSWHVGKTLCLPGQIGYAHMVVFGAEFYAESVSNSASKTDLILGPIYLNSKSIGNYSAYFFYHGFQIDMSILWQPRYRVAPQKFGLSAARNGAQSTSKNHTESDIFNVEKQLYKHTHRVKDFQQQGVLPHTEAGMATK